MVVIALPLVMLVVAEHVDDKSVVDKVDASLVYAEEVDLAEDEMESLVGMDSWDCPIHQNWNAYLDLFVVNSVVAD